MFTGSLNGTIYHDEDAYNIARRGFGPIESDEELVAYWKKATAGRGWPHGDIAYASFGYHDLQFTYLLKAEIERLKAIKERVRKERDEAEKAREWKYVKTRYWMDNSEEELWVDKDGNEEWRMTVGPHGDLC